MSKFWTVLIVLFAMMQSAACCSTTTCRAAILIPCKYSVRDVAFVNVHQTAWQLNLVKPDGIDSATFESWNSVLRTKLKKSNMGWVWMDPDSHAARRFADSKQSDYKGLPCFYISANELQIENPRQLLSDSFDGTIEWVVNSARRTQILASVAKCLCVVVVFESADKLANENVRSVAKTAIDKLENQMWTLDKATDNPPQLVVVSSDELQDEFWLRSSLGVTNVDTPSVAIVFGQGRRLGNVISGDDITTDKLVARMRICGQDCECALDREWLYGNQIVHIWDKKLERAAEIGLDFDPSSSFVIAEVSQIIRKHSGDSEQANVDIGGGLVIHELPTNADIGPSDENRPSENVTNPDDNNIRLSRIETTGPIENSNLIPWNILLVIVTALLSFVTFVLMYKRSSENVT